LVRTVKKVRYTGHREPSCSVDNELKENNVKLATSGKPGGGLGMLSKVVGLSGQ
jgi:hypothetical protein